MPHITTAMRKSVGEGVRDVLLRSVLGKRDITGEVNNVKTTFSSWDNCMAKTYCKWPVIIGIIVGGLIVLSIVWCIIRCACCGMSCCCTCFSFLKCCDCCGGCCDGKKNRPHKHLDTNLYPPQQGYQAPPPIMGGALTPGPPQYAQFEVGRNGLAVDPKSSTLNEDALPPMPSWETATKKHVLTEEEKNAVELGELDPATGQKFPLMAGAAGTGISQPPSPAHDLSASPYGPRPGQGQGGNGYTEVWGDQYAQQNQSAYEQNGREYRGYDQGPAMGGRGYGQISPTEMDSGVGQGYETASPQDHYGNDNGYFGTANGEGYSRPPPQHQYSNNNDRNYPPQPIRQYSEDSSHQLVPSRQLDRSYQNDRYQSNGSPRGISGPGRMASPPMNNNSGFGFGTGAPQQQYLSRPSPPPQQMSYDSAYSGNTAPPTYASRSPPPQDHNYSGYGTYHPSSNQDRGLGNYRSERGGREPQNWDPVQR